MTLGDRYDWAMEFLADDLRNKGALAHIEAYVAQLEQSLTELSAEKEKLLNRDNAELIGTLIGDMIEEHLVNSYESI